MRGQLDLEISVAPPQDLGVPVPLPDMKFNFFVKANIQNKPKNGTTPKDVKAKYALGAPSTDMSFLGMSCAFLLFTLSLFKDV